MSHVGTQLLFDCIGAVGSSYPQSVWLIKIPTTAIQLTSFECAEQSLPVIILMTLILWPDVVYPLFPLV